MTNNGFPEIAVKIQDAELNWNFRQWLDFQFKYVPYNIWDIINGLWLKKRLLQFGRPEMLDKIQSKIVNTTKVQTEQNLVLVGSG